MSTSQLSSPLGGLDGGVYLRAENLERVLELAEERTVPKELADWMAEAKVHFEIIEQDVGLAPPRPSFLTVAVPPAPSRRSLDVCLDAWQLFGFGEIPSEVESIMRQQDAQVPATFAWKVSVGVVPDGFLRMGILFPNPTEDHVQELISLAVDGTEVGEKQSKLRSIGGALQLQPSSVEYSVTRMVSEVITLLQCLMPGFGYEVYKVAICNLCSH